MREKIEAFLTEKFLFEFDDELTYDSDLFKVGVLDSMGYIQLIRFLESEFEIQLTEEELLSQVLVSCNGMADFVSQKLDTAAASAGLV